MPNLTSDIDSYALTTYPSRISEDVITVKDFDVESKPENIWSTRFWDININDSRRKERKIADVLYNISSLTDNWDEEGSAAIREEVINDATAIVYMMEAAGENLFSIAPGPKGEIMLDYRVNEKSLEIILYPDRKKYVKFSDNEQPIQGKFTYDILPNLISWLNN